MSKKDRFIPDIWKKLPRNEPTDLRVNFGFSAKREFGETLLIQELNYESIPTVEADTKRETALEHVRERIIAFQMGKATLVSTREEVNNQEGRYLKLPLTAQQTFASHGLIAMCYLQRFCIPVFRAYSIAECQQSVLNPSAIDPQITEFTEWMSHQLCGHATPIPGEEENDTEMSHGNEQTLFDVHRSTPNKPLVKAYHIRNSKHLDAPIVSSKRGEPTKKDVFDEMLARSNVELFRINDENAYLKLMVDYERICTAMAEAAAEAEANVEDIFSSWATWGDTFAYRDAQRAWSPEGVADLYKIVKDSKRDVSTPVDMAHNTTTTLTETINLRNLKDRLLLGEQLEGG